jgi:hypothetical protein
VTDYEKIRKVPMEGTESYQKPFRRGCPALIDFFGEGPRLQLIFTKEEEWCEMRLEIRDFDALQTETERVQRSFVIEVFRPPGPYDSFFRPPPSPEVALLPWEEASWEKSKECPFATAYLDKVLVAAGRSRGGEPDEKEFDE